MNRGFSLIELIVVIAIMAILVGVAVPVYTGYISKAEENVDKQYADDLERAINTVCIDLQSSVTKLERKIGNNWVYDIPTRVIIDGSTVTVEGIYFRNDGQSAFVELLTRMIDLSKNEYKYTFTIVNGVVAGEPKREEKTSS